MLCLLLFLLLSRPFGNIIHDIAEKYDHINTADLQKLEKLSIKSRKAELDLNFIRNVSFCCYGLLKIQLCTLYFVLIVTEGDNRAVETCFLK